jgi:hypothetical protein
MTASTKRGAPLIMQVLSRAAKVRREASSVATDGPSAPLL